MGSIVHRSVLTNLKWLLTTIPLRAKIRKPAQPVLDGSRALLMRRREGAMDPFDVFVQTPTPKSRFVARATSLVTSSCASCGFLRSRLEPQSWNSFNLSPCKLDLAGVPTLPDSSKTPQLKTSKLGQNCGKTEILHLQPSYGIYWKSKLFPQCKIHPVLDVCYYSLTG